MITCLDKLERIRQEMHADKVFDVVGRLFEQLSLRQYLEAATTDEGVAKAEQAITGTLTREQVDALRIREQRLYGDGGDVRSELPRLRASLQDETYRHLLPGYVRRFIEKAAPLLSLSVDGDLDTGFTLHAVVPEAIASLAPVLARYTPEQQARLTVYRPDDRECAIFLHPGEPVFEAMRAMVIENFSQSALDGAVFVDPAATAPYFFHIALLCVLRRPEPTLRALSHEETLEYRLVALCQDSEGIISSCPVEQLLLLQNAPLPADPAKFSLQPIPLSAAAASASSAALAFARERLAHQCVQEHRLRLLSTLQERVDFIKKGYALQEVELLERRNVVRPKADAGDPNARGQLTVIKNRQASLYARREEALAVLQREPELIEPAAPVLLARALVVPSFRPASQLRQEIEAEAIAMGIAREYEEAHGAVVHDVSTVPLALAAGLGEHPGFDLRSRRPSGDELAIEVKGRAGMDGIEMTENEYIQACNLGDRYWLYAVFDCASARPRLERVQNPFRKLIARSKGSVIITGASIFANAEPEDH